MKTYQFEKVSCPKCGSEYAVPKGMAKAFKCPSRRCAKLSGSIPEEPNK